MTLEPTVDAASGATTAEMAYNGGMNEGHRQFLASADGARMFETDLLTGDDELRFTARTPDTRAF